MKQIKVNEFDVVNAWNEAEELLTSLHELSDEELIECREALKERAYAILTSLDDYVNEDNLKEHCNK
jgi:hypothetical protein